MNKKVHDFIRFIAENNAVDTKQALIDTAVPKFGLIKDGAVYHTDFFAVVFCYSKNRTFSNVVLSLSKLEKYDHIPCFVVLVRKDLENRIFMINSTFLDKVSHSSKLLRTDNIRGSFLGSNIRKEIEEVDCKNTPDNFDTLFAYHQGFTWSENLERLVERTNQIKPNTTKAEFSKDELRNIYLSPERAVEFIASDDYVTLLHDLRAKCEAAKEMILMASHIDNVNIRGRLIEALITADAAERRELLANVKEMERQLPAYDTKNSLGDYVRSFKTSDTYTDIKTKILYLDSNPKAYNIDKFLKCMAEEKSVFMFFFIGINENGIVNTILASVYDKRLLATTILQHHWSGRGTRGTAQFNGKTINTLLLDPEFSNNIDKEACKPFLDTLIER